MSCERCEGLLPPERPLESNRVCPECAHGFPLTRLDMDGAFPLEASVIERELTEKAPGNYALGYMDRDDFVVSFVGRSDTDVRSRLRAWVGTASQYRAYAPSGRAAWGLNRRRIVPLNAPALACASSEDSSYTHFAYSYATTAEDAYAKHWRNYDDFGGDHLGLDNSTAPAASAAGG